MTEHLSIHNRLKRAHAARFGPEPEPRQSGWSILGDWFCRLVLLILFILAIWFYVLWTPATWIARKFL